MWAQQRELPVVARLGSGAAFLPGSSAGFLKGLSEVGYGDKQNVVVETHFANDHYERLPDLAAELVRRRVAVIVASGAVNAVLAAKSATSTIPIVFAIGSNPVEFGLVSSLSSPGGNVTGVTLLTRDLLSKRLEVLREIVPRASTIALIVNETNPNTASAVQEGLVLARAGGWHLHVIPVNSDLDREPAFARLAQLQVGGIFFAPDNSFNSKVREFVALSARYRLPTVYNYREFVEAGGLMSYGTSSAEANRLAGNYVGRILKGEKPTDLPVQQPTKFELVINLKTAKALGLTIPETLLATADEVIQ
jgi:putative ABC transport system substrate-binding protein